MKKNVWFIVLLFSIATNAQEYFPKNDGVKTTNTNYTAITNAKIFVTPTQIIEKGTLLIKDGKIIDSGTEVTIPKNTTVFNLDGKSIYPSFIDIFSDFGVEKPKRAPSSSQSQYDASRTGYYWNDHIMPENEAFSKFNFDSQKAKELLNAGFGVVNTHIQDGIHRGTGTLVALNNKDGNEIRIIKQNSAQYLSLSRSLASRQVYPGSIMGRIALLKQLYLDADWYAKGLSKTKDLSLEALNRNKDLVQIFDAGSKTNALRADKIGDQFGIQYIILGGGDEYERIAEIKKTNASFIIPINFRDAYDVENSFLTNSLSLSDMRAWNQEPSNPKILAANGINFALTTHELKSPSEFKNKLIKAIESGFSKEKALEALTVIPAKLLGQSSNIGSLNNGAFANFLITNGDIFDKKTILYENWVQGQQNIITTMNTKDILGDYEFSLSDATFKLSIQGDTGKLKSKITSDDKTLGSKISYDDIWLQITMTELDTTSQSFIRIRAYAEKDKSLVGTAVFSNGSETSFLAKKINKETKEDIDDKMSTEKNTTSIPESVAITYPNMAYGFKTLPKQETLLFKNATVWTSEKEGILKNTDVLIKNGKIAKIGSNISDASAKIIDATGKHLTAGIIDEHSHIGTDSVNENGQNSSAEVSIEDVIDAEDINVYRDLAGGVTTIQILHGSANPIGGQSAIVKLKWGESADNYIYDNSPKFIKFALGENVKQSRYSNGVRFPQSRMGVEQVYIDYFTRAKEYDKLKKSGKPYRKDLEMEVLSEILNKERFITCHSYVQSEINMLMKVAEKFNFKINTFTHILEGYKVADKMAEHGVGGSTFSDWWAYKFEVNDAIPYNASIMHHAGVTVAINSDDAETSRRLNQEAGKTIKYGGMSEEEAWQFITLNPAKLLHIDNRVGSIKVGKDADIVLWSDHPMSIYAKAEKTIIEGATYFDLERDTMMREEIKKEKAELINQMLKAKNRGLKTQPIKKKVKELMHCDHIDHDHN
ncbi:amidohydrolase family protein [Pseudalgibacter alginicilyticus]